MDASTIGALAVLFAYLIGGIPFGLIFFRAAGGGDIRRVGSGNIGATNVARAGGWAAGVLTLAFDAAKGSVSVFVALAATGEAAWAASAGLGAVAGHCFPVYLRFRGGKGVATGCGAFAVLDPAAMSAALGVFLLAVALTRMVSAGSVLAALTFPVAMIVLGGDPAPALWAAAAGLLIVGRHLENLKRIARGVERRLGEQRRENP